MQIRNARLEQLHQRRTHALAAEVADLHADAQEAAQVALLCQIAAGRRLVEIRESMRAVDWTQWVRSPECPISPAMVGQYMRAAAELEVPEEPAL